MEKFTDNKIRGWKAEPKPYEKHDGNGLYLRVEKGGSKIFYYVFRENKKRRRIRIGKFDAVTLTEAREQHRNLIRLRERGELDKNVVTYGDIYTKYIKKYANTYADNGKEFQRIHDKDILSHIGHIDITKLSKSDILPIQEAKQNTPRQANITVEKISKVCRYAKQLDLVPYNIMDDFPKLQENEPRQRVLTTEEIKSVVKNRNRSTIEQIYYIMLCTGMRGGEVRNMLDKSRIGHWIDVEQRKGGKVSVKAVYLPVSVRRMKLGRISPKTTIARMCEREKRGYTPHDIRRTAATLLVEKMGFADYLVDRWLGHSVSKLKRTYIVSQRTDDLRQMTIRLNKYIRTCK